MPRKLPSRAAPAALVAAALPAGATARGADGVRYADIPADAVPSWPWFARLPDLADGGVSVIRMGILENTALGR